MQVLFIVIWLRCRNKLAMINLIEYQEVHMKRMSSKVIVILIGSDICCYRKCGVCPRDLPLGKNHRQH